MERQSSRVDMFIERETFLYFSRLKIFPASKNKIVRKFSSLLSGTYIRTIPTMTEFKSRLGNVGIFLSLSLSLSLSLTLSLLSLSLSLGVSSWCNG